MDSAMDNILHFLALKSETNKKTKATPPGFDQKTRKNHAASDGKRQMRSDLSEGHAQN
jgi:hypothetical protein